MNALIQRMQHIRKSMGLRAAAGYLRNRKVDFAEAHFLLLGTAPRK